MATYVMADIHGCYTEFQTMLKKIKFDGEKDELIIAGDIIDRGNENYEMLEYASSYPEGVTFLMGNHDKDFIYYCMQLGLLYKKHKVPADLDLRELVSDSRYDNLYNYHVIDHYETVRQLILDEEHPVRLEDFRRWADTLIEFPFYVRREVSGRRYIIVHAGYISEEEYWKAKSEGAINPLFKLEDFYVWAREEGMDYGEENATIVFRVSGIITIGEDPKSNKKPKERTNRAKLKNVTIAGQTAPGEGILIRGGKINLGGSENVIIRNIRCRVGLNESDGFIAGAGLGIENANNIIIDHCCFGSCSYLLLNLQF